jgi:hypothetical protein
MEPALRDRMIRLGEELGQALGVGVSVLCDKLVGDTSFIKRLRSERGYTVRKYDQFMAGASALWPDEKTAWPVDIPRPEPRLTDYAPRGQRAAAKAQSKGGQADG